MYTQKKSIENVHIVRERDRQRFRELLAVFALGLPIGLFLLLFTWQNLEVIRLGHETTRLQETRKQIEEENKRLQYELDRLTALESVEDRAVRLGFAPADPKSIVMVKGSAGQPALPVRNPARSNSEGRASSSVRQEP
jgi:cell division protein FtsL